MEEMQGIKEIEFKGWRQREKERVHTRVCK